MNRKMSERLDYDIYSTDDRLELVSKVIEEHDSELVNYYDNHYNPHISQNGFTSEGNRVSKDLEAMANYLLYAKEESSDDIITEYREKRNIQREASINNLIKVREHKKETNRSIIKFPKIKVYKKDRLEHKELEASGEVIDTLTKMIETGINTQGKTLSLSEIKKLKWIRTDIQKDEIVVKSELKKYISFQSITEVIKDHEALSYIQFDNPEVIRILIEDYGELKESSYDDTFGYMKIILFALEELIELADFEDYVFDILTWKVEGLQYAEMIRLLNEKYGITLNSKHLSKMTRQTIPNAIVDAYKKQKEDWVYTYILEGKYVACIECNEIKLLTPKYFYKSRTSKNGLRKKCKDCMRIWS